MPDDSQSDQPKDDKEGIKIIIKAGQKAWEKTHPPKGGKKGA